MTDIPNFAFPTVDWVKEPVDLDTGHPSGLPVRRRHLKDCDHWYRDDAGALLGGPPRRASHAEITDLAPCADCARRAELRGDPADGPRGLAPLRRYWWVSQGYNHETAIEQQTLWSLPKKGRDLPDRRLLKEMQVGDVVLHYADKFLRAVSIVTHEWLPATRPEGYRMREGDGDDGWLVGVDVQTTALKLHFHEIQKLISSGPPGPLDKNGTPRQIYVARLTDAEATRLLDAAGADVPAVTESGLLGRPVSHWDFGETDSVVLSRIRTEQGILRKHLLRGRDSAPCDICGRHLPSNLLVAAHIVPRRDLTHQERVEFDSVAMLACVLGCDALFEWGYIVVTDSGFIAPARPAESESLLIAVTSVVGNECLAYNDNRSPRFTKHRQIHTTEMEDFYRV